MAEEAAKEAGPTGKEAAPNGGGKPIVLYIVIVVNIIAMLAMVMMVMKGKQKEAAEPGVKDVVQGEHEAQKEEEAKEPEFLGKTIPMETFLVNLAGARGSKILKVNMELEVEGEKVSEEIEKRKPQIRDIIIILLSSKTYGQLQATEGKEFLRDEIRDTVNSFLTKGKIKKVLFTEFIFN